MLSSCLYLTVIEKQGLKGIFYQMHFMRIIDTFIHFLEPQNFKWKIIVN